MRLHFLGANRQVTGSRYLLEAGGLRIMVDCGMFQERKFLGHNWKTPLADPGSVDWLLLTHAHLDHSGLVPRLVGHGFDGPILATEPSAELAELIMTDSARIQAEDAKYKKKRHKKAKRKSKYPVVPLYDDDDVRQARAQLRSTRHGEPVRLNESVTVTFHEAGHILGSSILELIVSDNGAVRRVIFSGDVGQWDKPLIRDPTLLDEADYVVMESTYGDRNHKEGPSPEAQLAEIINDTVDRGGNVVVPTFAIERAQELVYHLSRLVHEDKIPDIRIFLDSPMAADVTDIFRKYRGYLDDQTHRLFESGQPPLRFPGLKLTRSVDESKAINQASGSSVIMSTSGMCTAGRIKHHLRRNIGRPESAIVFVGYQAEGTLGRHILNGGNPVRIHGQEHTVRAKIQQIQGFSAHGDRDDLVFWLGHFRSGVNHVFLTHGEEKVALSLAETIQDKLDMPVSVPEFKQVVTLD